jgi:hypothetical protein
MGFVHFSRTIQVKKRLLNSTIGLLAPALLLCGQVSHAGPVNGPDGDVSPNVIFGTGGNANGSFTGQGQNNIEVALRGKQRYPAANIFNYDLDKTYTFDSTVLTTNPANRSVFNFEWSINVDQGGTTGDTLSDFLYLLSVDTDASAGVTYASIDPFNTPGYFDHALGTNTTLAGQGIESTSEAELSTNMASYNVAQQSSNLGFGFSADPDAPGIYDFKMEVFSLQNVLLSSAEITVIVEPVPRSQVPVPATLPVLLGGIGALGFFARRRKSKSA